jgi:hypothetical protein
MGKMVEINGMDCTSGPEIMGISNIVAIKVQTGAELTFYVIELKKEVNELKKPKQ